MEGKELVCFTLHRQHGSSSYLSKWLLLPPSGHTHTCTYTYISIPLYHFKGWLRGGGGLCARQEMQGLAQDGSDSDLCQCPTRWNLRESSNKYLVGGKGMGRGGGL